MWQVVVVMCRGVRKKMSKCSTVNKISVTHVQTIIITIMRNNIINWFAEVRNPKQVNTTYNAALNAHSILKMRCLKNTYNYLESRWLVWCVILTNQNYKNVKMYLHRNWREPKKSRITLLTQVTAYAVTQFQWHNHCFRCRGWNGGRGLGGVRRDQGC